MRGFQPRPSPPWDGQSTRLAAGLQWHGGEIPEIRGKKAAQAVLKVVGIAELGWDPAARLAGSPPMVGSPQPWRSCYHPSPPITHRNSPPFSSPADVLWLRLRKITTPLLDTADASSSGTKSKEEISHVLIKSNFPCTPSCELPGEELPCFT